MKQPPLILVDGSSYFFRAFHALPPLTNTKGQPTGAIYGVVNMIKRLIKDYKPTQLVVIFDAPGKTFRDEWYPEYKAHRAPTPPELISQFNPLVSILNAMGIPLIIMPGVEADDVIGTLAEQATVASVPVLISTSDKDMAQLVNEHVTLVNTMTNHVLDVAGVQQKFGVSPQQIIDYLTLIGDTSDNIPGVPKCGPKTAVKWLSQYHSLDALINSAAEISGKVGESLRASLPKLELSKRLVTIKTDLELPLSLQELTIKPSDFDALVALAEELELKNWLKEWSTQTTVSVTKTELQNSHSYQLISDINGFESILNAITIQKTKCLYFYINISDNKEALGLSFSFDATRAFYFPLTPETVQLAFNKLKPHIEDTTLPKVGYNLKQAYHLLKTHDVTLAGLLYDVMLESYLLNSTARNHDLITIIQTYLPEIESPTPEAMSTTLFKLHHVLLPMLTPSLTSLLETIEIPLLLILAQMEHHGVLIDLEQLQAQGMRLNTRIQTLEEEAHQLAKHPFNLNSPKQLLEILYHEQKLPILAKTPTGQPSTSEAVLQELAYAYDLPALILEYRSLSKLVSTYIEALPKRVNPKTHRVHTSYNQTITTTGRLSSSDPNLQNIPIRNTEGRLIRKAFVAPSNHIILSADYSQIELRIMAHLSGDQQLQYAFSQGWDIHAATASEIFSTPLNDVTSEQRRRAKAVNFGLIYGMSSFGLSKQLGIERSDAQHYINLYFERYPGVLNFMQKTREQAQNQGYVETLLGRLLHVPEINSHNKIRQKAAERIAINGPLQGTAADIIKQAMIAIATWQKTLKNKEVCMIMQVHDELVFEVHESYVEEAKKYIRTHMEESVKLNVPLVVSIGIGKDWDEAH
jgi:DNA polymerase-1